MENDQKNSPVDEVTNVSLDKGETVVVDMDAGRFVGLFGNHKQAERMMAGFVASGRVRVSLTVCRLHPAASILITHAPRQGTLKF